MLFIHYDWGWHKYTIGVLNKIEKTEKKNRKRKWKPPSNVNSFGASSDYYLPEQVYTWLATTLLPALTGLWLGERHIDIRTTICSDLSTIHAGACTVSFLKLGYYLWCLSIYRYPSSKYSNHDSIVIQF